MIIIIIIYILCIIHSSVSYFNNNININKYNNKMKLYNNNNNDMINNENDNNEILEYDYSKGIKRKVNGQYKKIKDNRDMLPFSITYKNIDGSTSSLGSWYLDASTSNGDILSLGNKGNYVVQTVSFLYKFTGSSFKVIKKKLSVEAISKSLWNENNNDSILQ